MSQRRDENSGIFSCLHVSLDRQKLQGWIERGDSHVTFVIGGADGLDDAVRARADLVLSFGPMTWPHMLARVLLCEQIWRAVSILTRHPYHRD